MRHIITSEERAKGNRRKREESQDAYKQRRKYEMALLDRMLAELSMREWYPHQ